jgi:hypothetical protein
MAGQTPYFALNVMRVLAHPSALRERATYAGTSTGARHWMVNRALAALRQHTAFH